MTIKDIKEELNTSTGPIIKSLHQGTDFKVLIMGFNQGMILKEHKTHIRSKLTILEGAIVYKEENRVIELKQYDEVDIPIEVSHSLVAVENSLCLLTKG